MAGSQSHAACDAPASRPAAPRPGNLHSRHMVSIKCRWYKVEVESLCGAGSTARTIADIIRFRLQMIAAGDEDGNDATGLRLDPLFKLAVERLQSGSDLCSHSTISRLENLPDARTLLRLGRALVDLYCASFRQLAKGIVLDIDDTFDAVPGSQQLCLFDAHDDDDPSSLLLPWNCPSGTMPKSLGSFVTQDVSGRPLWHLLQLCVLRRVPFGYTSIRRPQCCVCGLVCFA